MSTKCIGTFKPNDYITREQLAVMLYNYAKYKGKRFYIIDDIYATGNTVKAITNAIESLGGFVVGAGVVLNIKELNNDDIYSLIDINEEN